MTQYKRCEDVFFVNPYTFVDVDRKTKQVEDAEEIYQKESLHTGYLECKLVTRTPLGIPDDEKKQVDGNGHAKYPFFSVCDGEPLIPGSSIRGVIRSVYETVSDSCLSTMQENTGLSFRVENNNAYEPGLLIRENNQWQLYTAERYRIPCKKKNSDFKMEIRDGKRVITYGGKIYQYGDPVSFKIAGINGYGRSSRPRGNRAICSMQPVTTGDAYVYIGEAFSNKKSEGVFKKKERCRISTGQINTALELLEESLNVYRNRSVNKIYQENPKNSEKGQGIWEIHTGYAGFERAKRAGVLPVWYTRKNGLLRFSMAAIGRFFAKKTLNDLVGKKVPCKERGELCDACKLFGMTGGRSIGSRVRFSDAEFVGDEKKDERMTSATLKELALPRYSYLPFHVKGRSREVKSYDDPGVEIRGRKFYWHNLNLKIDDGLKIYETKEKTQRNITLELVEAGNEFRFRVFYDGISREQLEQLKWVLTLGENREDSRLCHKIGHGKPLGLGSCKIVVLSEVERSTGVGEELSYGITCETDRAKLAGEIDETWKKRQSYRGLLKVCDLDAVKGEKVKYPYIETDGMIKQGENENDYANHQWFKRNKKDMRQLPDVLEEDQRLNPYAVKSDMRGSDHRKNSNTRHLGNSRKYDESKNISRNRKKYQKQ
ncbi:MAG TPA: TIGR03986 family CRISPR-associated RAMP protein [Lachnospiraceae bacterium]|nr:TIGR03986 family CRISPR-associated RAMP protein [Lachnospiraceae bacterium]